jgi:uncharacterized protein YlxW (UPF0749 family)
MKINKHISITLVCIILGITLAWQYQSIRYNTKSISAENSKKEELITMVLNERENNDNLRKKNDELTSEINKFESARGNNDENIKLLTDEINKLRIIAGLTEVKGKGVIITINEVWTLDSEGNSSSLLDLINEMKASDTQAISINEERIIATSEIRIGGSYIVVNGRQIIDWKNRVEPLVIKAIADPDNVENALKMIGGVKERLKLDGIDLNFEKSDNIIIPKVRDEEIRTDMLTPVVK